ncbi:GumC family protein [Pinisolibacter sp.]|uniref:GumC family protein n=1 Tax=Pinisolibacter sp. TaxID=2172024 RepID=UPI002FDCAD49
MSGVPLEQRTVAATASAVPGDEATAVDLAVVGRLLARRWWLVALITALFLGLAGAYVVLAPKTWRAATRVLLDPRDKQLVGSDVNKPQYSIEAGWVETRVELVKSFGNLAAVVKKEGLAADPEIVGANAADLGPEALDARAVRNLAEMVVVERPKENNIVDVTVTTKSAEKSARLSQAVAEAFVAGLAQAKVAQIEQANALLSRQVETMRQKMMEAEAKVEEYKRANGIAVTRGNLVDEETLRQLNEGLVAARQKAQDAKERWDKLKQVLKSGEIQFPAGLDGVGSSVLSRLKIEAALAAKRRTEVEQDYGPLHPKARAAAAEMDRDRALILDQVKSLTATAEMDYQLARAAEDNVRKNLDRAQARLADKGEATVALQELENEALARRELYKSFVSRMEETHLQKSTQISDATIVSPAQVPLKPYSPRVAIILGLALLAGLGSSISAALLRGRRDVAALLAERRRESASVEPPVARRLAAVIPEDVAPAAAPTFADDPVAEPPPTSDPDTELRAEPAPTTTAPTAEPPSRPVRASVEPVRVDLALTPERIARLGGLAEGGGAVIDAFVVAPDGRTDVAGLAGLRRLAAELGEGLPRVRVLFSNSVPTPIVAALAHGFARAEAVRGASMMVIDLAADPSPFDEAFERAAPIARSRRRRVESGFDVRVDEHGVGFARPSDDLAAAGPSRRAGRLADFVAAAMRDHDGVVLHLGGSPSAAVLFDAAEVADHVTLVVDDKDLGGRRVAGEIDVMRGLLPHFDGIVVLRVADGSSSHRDDRRRSRRA